MIRRPRRQGKGRRVTRTYERNHKTEKAAYYDSVRLFSLILNQMGGAELLGGVRYTVSETGAYFQSVKGIAEFSACKIVLTAAKSSLCITGECLCILKLYGGDLLIGGKIKSVEKCV